eukprot:TRINITY_DN24737_c0_g1_i1.p1 TRINITY_DN24737_c0_g1~~TRINITY_DN24737_c0_g1_i1.p1  ORF type:complete len:366 (-),score=58.23 TRINITY_DN24737_c0_g1_i1:80-1177(-)
MCIRDRSQRTDDEVLSNAEIHSPRRSPSLEGTTPEGKYIEGTGKKPMKTIPEEKFSLEKLQQYQREGRVNLKEKATETETSVLEKVSVGIQVSFQDLLPYALLPNSTHIRDPRQLSLVNLGFSGNNRNLPEDITPNGAKVSFPLQFPLPSQYRLDTNFTERRSPEEELYLLSQTPNVSNWRSELSPRFTGGNGQPRVPGLSTNLLPTSKFSHIRKGSVNTLRYDLSTERLENQTPRSSSKDRYQPVQRFEPIDEQEDIIQEMYSKFLAQARRSNDQQARDTFTNFLNQDGSIPNIEEFRHNYIKMVEAHQKCGSNCIHLKRFYLRIGFESRYQDRTVFHLKKALIRTLPKVKSKSIIKLIHGNFA